MKKSLTLIELLVIVGVVGILASLGVPVFEVIKERMLDKEAKTNLVVIQGAEKICMIESGSYYVSSVISDINNYVKVGFRTFITVGKIYIVAGENDGIITLLNDKGDYDSYNYN